MENPTAFTDSFNDEQPVSSESPVVYPPKYQQAPESSNVWMKSFVSLALYLILGYYIFPSYIMLLIITGIVIFHELGHFFAMKYYKYSELGIFFIPLLGAYVSGTKREVSQKQSAIILLAGPLPGIILGIIFYFIDQQHEVGYYPFDVSLQKIAELMILLNLINLFPVYPLDGGQLLNRVFLDEESILSKVFIFLSAAFMCWIAWKSGLYILFVFPAMMLLRLRPDTKFNAAEKKIEEQGINADTSYEDLPDEDYWKMRNIVIEEYSAYKDVPLAPPYEFDSKEEKIMTTIQSLLHRHLIQDVSILGKLFIILLWVAAIAAPWLIKMNMSIFTHLGF